MLTFGVMLFGIGLGSSEWGWYPPIFWTRAFAALALLLVATWQRLRSRHSTITGADLARRPNSKRMFGIGLAAVVGLLETIGLLVYSFDTQLASTGLAAAVSSSWGILPLVAGISIFHERPVAYQLLGVALVLTGLFLLAIKPA
jgi:drug/metabolite transporter (DMT)-like permease